jgi:hypothetical protein
MATVAVLAVSLPAAVPALAAAGDKVKFDQSSVSAGAINSTFTLKVSSNTVTKMQGIQVGFDFNKTYLNLTAISRAGTACDTSADFSCVNASNYWINADTKPNGTNVANSNTAGQSLGWAASYNQSIETAGGTIPVGTDVQFLNLTFKVIACPANGVIPAAAGDTAAIQLIPAVGTTAGTQFTDTTGGPVTPVAADLGTVDVTCTPPVADDFSLSASPTTVSVSLPTSGSNTGSTTVTNNIASGAGKSATLSITAPASLPTGVSAAFVPSTPIAAGGSATLTFTVTTAASTNAGIPITITGTPTTGSTHTTSITLVITSAPAGPPPATGTTNVTGTTDAGFLGLMVPAETNLTLRRNWPNQTSVPVLVFTNTSFTLSIEDAMPAGKLTTDRGHMTDTGFSPAHRLTDPMQAQVGANPKRTLDVVGPQSLLSDSSGITQTVNVSLLQQTESTDPPGSFAINLTFSVLPGF